jgi:hypothetical protein
MVRQLYGGCKFGKSVYSENSYTPERMTKVPQIDETPENLGRVPINKLGLLISHDFGGCVCDVRDVRERCPRRELNESVFSEASGRVELGAESSEVQYRHKWDRGWVAFCLGYWTEEGFTSELEDHGY